VPSITPYIICTRQSVSLSRCTPSLSIRRLINRLVLFLLVYATLCNHPTGYYSTLTLRASPIQQKLLVCLKTSQQGPHFRWATISSNEIVGTRRVIPPNFEFFRRKKKSICFIFLSRVLHNIKKHFTKGFFFIVNGKPSIKC
jgi:hypothetical protein